MSIITQAAKRLEELRRGGVQVPWEAAGLSEAQFNELLGKTGKSPGEGAAPAAEVHHLSRDGGRQATPAERQGVAPREPSRRSSLVEIDLQRLANEGYLAPDLVRSALAMEFRQIKRPLLRNAASRAEGQGRNALIMVTSGMPGEGKTFSAINLAMSMAMEVDTSVLLIDADVVQPSVFGRLGLTERAGLLDVLTDPKTDLADVIVRTNVPKLSLLPAGTSNAMATELLASAAMDRLLVELAERYSDRVIILDSPPLLITTESRVLASRVGQVLVVVDAVTSGVAEVSETFKLLENCPLVMSVLNKCPDLVHKRSYDYRYGYR